MVRGRGPWRRYLADTKEGKGCRSVLTRFSLLFALLRTALRLPHCTFSRGLRPRPLPPYYNLPTVQLYRSLIVIKPYMIVIKLYVVARPYTRTGAVRRSLRITHRSHRARKNKSERASTQPVVMFIQPIVLDPWHDNPAMHAHANAVVSVIDEIHDAVVESEVVAARRGGWVRRWRRG